MFPDLFLSFPKTYFELQSVPHTWPVSTSYMRPGHITDVLVNLAVSGKT